MEPSSPDRPAVAAGVVYYVDDLAEAQGGGKFADDARQLGQAEREARYARVTPVLKAFEEVMCDEAGGSGVVIDLQHMSVHYWWVDPDRVAPLFDQVRAAAPDVCVEVHAAAYDGGWLAEVSRASMIDSIPGVGGSDVRRDGAGLWAYMQRGVSDRQRIVDAIAELGLPAPVWLTRHHKELW